MVEIKKYKNTIESFLEYVLVTAIILECNSLLRLASCEESSVNMNYVFAMLIGGAGLCLVAIKILNSKIREQFIKEFLPILCALEGFVFAYFILGVLPTEGMKSKADYIAKFIIMLPLLSSVFFLERKEGHGVRLWNRFSTVMSIIAALNLAVYYTSTLHTNELYSEQVYLHWYNRGRISSLVNCLNVCFLMPGTMAQSFNLQYLRDFGPFSEPLMFLIPLGVALFTELFLCPESDRWRLWKQIVLSLTIFTVQSTNGLILLVAAWGLKLISMCNKKEARIVLIPMATLVVAGAGYFIRYKALQKNYVDVTAYIMQNKHFTDYVFAIKAFLNKPLLGGGYLNEDYIYSFFTEEAKRDAGLSNTISVVLGQGGIMLGLLCMMPFLICLVQIFRQNNKNIAFWALGPLYLYSVTIFHYRFFLIMILAFGYSLLELDRNSKVKKVWPQSIVVPQNLILNYGERGDSFVENLKAEFNNVCWKLPLVLLFGMIYFIWNGTEIWNNSFEILWKYQLTVGQSAIRVMYVVISLIACLVCLRFILGTAGSITEKCLSFILFAAAQIGYSIVYPTVYSYVDTVSALWLRDIEFIRETLALGLYLIYLMLILALCGVIKGTLTNDEKRFVPGKRSAITMTVMAVIVVLGLTLINIKMNSKIYLIDNQLESIKKVLEVSKGKVYSDELPLLYKKVLPDMSCAVMRGNGYRLQENASILEPMGKELTTLFNEGYQVTQINDDHILYTNDQNVISELSGEGNTFYRYYAFEREYSLLEAARINDLEYSQDTEGETLTLEGNEHSIVSGPGDTWQPGRYTVTFNLRIDPEKYKDVDPDAVICRTQVRHDKGEKTDQTVDVTKGDFDEEGKAEIKNILSIGSVTEGYEYLVLAENDYQVGVRKISYQQTPTQITLSRNNVHQKPIYEAYYGKDGNPAYTSQGYAARRCSYNSADRVTEVKYLDEEDKPVITTYGYAEIRYEYDDKMNLIKEAYFDTEGEPITLEKGYSEILYSYDDRGNRSEYRYCDAEGNLIAQPNGIGMIRYKYDDKHRWIRCEYYDQNETKLILSSGYCTEERELNEDGLTAVTRYLGLENEPVLRTELYAEIHYFYDEQKRVIRQEYYDTEGKRTLTNSGISAFIYERDGDGNVTDEQYFGVNDERILNASGIGEIRRKFNSLNQKVSEEFLGTDGEAVIISEKYSIVDYAYDESGRLVKRIYKDTAGNVVEETDV